MSEKVNIVSKILNSLVIEDIQNFIKKYYEKLFVGKDGK